MLSIITGGRDVTSSAERAPFVARPIDRLAVGVITATNSPERADEILGGVAGACSGIKCGENRTERRREVRDGVERHAADRDAGHTPTCALTPRDVLTVGTFPPDPLTSEGADGRPCIPSSDRAGAKSGRLHGLSSVGPAAMLGHDIRKSEHAVPLSNHVRYSPSRAIVKPEADTLLSSVSGAYPHSPVSLCPVNQPETANPKAPRPAVSGAYSAWAVNPASNSLRSPHP